MTIQGNVSMTVWMSTPDEAPALSGYAFGLSEVDSLGNPIGDSFYNYHYAYGNVLGHSPAPFKLSFDVNRTVTKGHIIGFFVAVGATTQGWRYQVYFDSPNMNSFAELPILAPIATTTQTSTPITTTTTTQVSTVVTSTTATSTSTMSVIRGTIYWYDVYGNLCPVAWAQVLAIGEDGGTLIVTSSTADGSYMMWVAPGTYGLSVSRDPGFIPQAQNITVPDGGVVVVDFSLQPSGPAPVSCSVTTTQSTTTATTVGLQMQVFSNSTVSSLIFDSPRGLLNFTVSGPSGTYGFFDATIAKTLLSGQPIVMIDGVEHPASVTEDADFWYIHVTYSHSEHQITIGGSNTIPEFPPIPLLAISFRLVMVILRRRSS
jgi:hypothetical protein